MGVTRRLPFWLPVCGSQRPILTPRCLSRGLDHAVHDADAFLVAVKAGMGQFDRAIITFGVAAERPETGYGYLELAGSAGPIPVALTRFIEKPSADVAAALVTQHRITNPGKVAMVMIEVQTGAYLGDDDIIRYDDVYERT
jgi:hypothetical protein